MTRAALVVALLPTPLLALSACAPYFRPNYPLRAASGPTSVDVRKIDLRTSNVDVTLSDPRPEETIDGAWIITTGAPDGAPCDRKAAAKAVQRNGSAGAAAAYTLHFDRASLGAFVANAPIDDNRLVELLQNPSTLEVRVAGPGAPPSCLSIPISGDPPELRWTVEPWGDNPPFVGRDATFWLVSSSRYTTFAGDLTMLRVGRWWGPVRIGVGAGVGFGWGTAASPKGAFVIPASFSTEAFPLVGKHFALGLVAAYYVRPTFFQNTGFELIHGPSAGIELARLPVDLPGFLKGPRAATVGLMVTVARWLPDGGATVAGFGIAMN